MGLIFRYTDAVLRHVADASAGIADDPESGFPHLYHVAWNALAALDLSVSPNSSK